MVMVRSVREHTNNYGLEHGKSPKKTVDTEYDLPEPMAKTLSEAGLVEVIKAEAKPEAKAK